MTEADYLRIPAADLARVDDSGVLVAIECRDCRRLRPSAVFSRRGDVRRRHDCRQCVASRLAVRDAAV